MLGPADLLLRHGFSVLLPDARAHGASGGPIATYGVRETDDLHRWANWLEQSEPPHCVFGLGDSMGAAELLQSLSSIPDFCAVVAESSFASFREAAYDRIGQEFRTGPWLGRTLLRPVVEIGFLYTHWKYRIDLAHASPESAVAASRVPVLLIHGLADTNLPPRHSEEIKAANSAVVLWEPRYAGHCGASSAEPEAYERRVIGWFESHDRR
jgi:predicted alpha/beta-fold hydrolase